MNPLFLIPVIGVVILFMVNKSEASEPVNTDPFYRWDSLIKKYSAQFNVPWRWIKAIMMNESDLGRAGSVARGLASPQDIEASKSSDGKSWGLMQLTLPTARDFISTITAVGLNDPEISVKLGTQYLQRLIKLKGLNNREAVIRSYNGGPGYLNTAAGVRDTPIYYQKFLKNLAIVQQKQPGNELETG